MGALINSRYIFINIQCVHTGFEDWRTLPDVEEMRSVSTSWMIPLVLAWSL